MITVQGLKRLLARSRISEEVNSGSTRSDSVPGNSELQKFQVICGFFRIVFLSRKIRKFWVEIRISKFR